MSKSGRPKKTTVRKDRKIRRLSVTDLRKIAVDIRVEIVQDSELNVCTNHLFRVI